MKLDLNQIPKELISPVIDPNIPFDKYCTIDLSTSNPNLVNVNADSSDEWQVYIEEYLQMKNKQIAYGGYLERRGIYNRSAYFKNQENNRNIHLGIDLWSSKETPIHAVLDGKIHSFQNNENHGDYGPTIILEHQINSQNFYTLYGHLSLKSLDGISSGQKITSGDIIGWLGDSNVNGDYAPHLHFQIIEDLEGKNGDYPGVCSDENVDWYSKNCPNPLVLLIN